MSAIEDVLWPGMKALEPKSELGGILARKPGYHNSRDHLPADDYSVAQFAVDREGPANEGSAIDWTFPDAQAGNYTTISKYSKRLYAARGGSDSRTVYMREFFGQIDSDSTVEGWDYAKNKASSSDSSHLWHIHISIHRKYINSTSAMKAILSILKGETEEEWKAQNARDVVFQYFDGKMPVLKKGDSDPVEPSGTYYVTRAQRALQVEADGDYGPITAQAVKDLGIGKDGNTIDNDVWERLYATWGMTVTSSKVVDGGSKRDVTFQYFTNAKLPILKSGDSDDAGGVDGSGTAYVKRAQRQLQVDDDGIYGPQTSQAVLDLGISGYTGKTIDLVVWTRLNAMWGATETKKVTVDPAKNSK